TYVFRMQGVAKLLYHCIVFRSVIVTHIPKLAAVKSKEDRNRWLADMAIRVRQWKGIVGNDNQTTVMLYVLDGKAFAPLDLLEKLRRRRTNQIKHCTA